MNMISQTFQKYAMRIAWTQALIAMLGSLFFSLVMQLPPCDLCWYQRIAMYPLIIILGIGIMRKDKTSLLYAFPLAVIGWVIAVYHNLLYYSILPEAMAPCKAGISCTTRYVEWFGFLTIPLLSLLAFSLILVCLYAAHKKFILTP
jgi:disulfide bond formation protein DsbB